MTIKYYPLLLCLEESIEYIQNENDLNDATFYLSQSQKSIAICLYKTGQCYDLYGNEKPMLNLQQLTEKVQQALIDDGQCCVQKVLLETPQQAFDLLAHTDH
ncbi:hypothetical protein PSECIP111951_00455 [Pseudoalteromonas holothuriae]|uniref:Uncharacterized protein n=1 Tax=Pseudoalteromonas holothuriae TaxID=2963714 RepID=A0A9W4VLL0_9GAMM|nr:MULTISPECIES: hypothetical protein [unclassified Pseudoalteromonas]CAH9049736.1 hypothetical protein PSECIP111854_00350 [Pseudoalteromonas sp. CIP111854]CAH9051716.1 hypothetical protein PSECIP111951_00455 [Pseudoalteromonas sp. CIP111951]